MNTLSPRPRDTMMVANRHQEAVPAFADAFSRIGAQGHDAIGAVRKEAFSRFQTTGIPTTRVEAWKFTNIAKHANVAMAMATKSVVSGEDVSAFFAGGPLARRLIFINGYYSSELSHAKGLPEGVRIGPIDDQLTDEDVQSRIGALQDGRSFSDLNTALLQSGAVIEVDDGVKLDAPLQLIFLSVGQGGAVMIHPRILVRLGAHAEMHLIETHTALGGGHCLTNLVSQIEIGSQAKLTHDRLQVLHDGNTLVGKSLIEIGDEGQLHQTLLSLGGTLIRNESEVRLNGSRIDANMNGAFMPTAREHTDNLIAMHHLKPDCESNQFYKGVMDGHGRGVFAGKIFVYEDAQRTNAYQTNNNLLLSDDAEIDSKPELEIYADDVKCSHGATCGEHDETSLFYLRSRGIDRATAESIMTYAFAGEVIERFADDEIKRQAKEAIFKRLPGGDNLMEML